MPKRDYWSVLHCTSPAAAESKLSMCLHRGLADAADMAWSTCNLVACTQETEVSKASLVDIKVC